MVDPRRNPERSARMARLSLLSFFKGRGALQLREKRDLPVGHTEAVDNGRLEGEGCLRPAQRPEEGSVSRLSFTENRPGDFPPSRMRTGPRAIRGKKKTFVFAAVTGIARGPKRVASSDH